ncbi:spore germination protein [Paenibacillus sp. FSL H7-0331]|uniref:spore germination protein n=2 Tax=Paenibacillus sp. FSL H7-0331 TaxID=1920421 RepID=UPI00117BF5F1|nr:spore germination protein [Paenibacillus sp. FSL H7-0331]
MKDSILKIGDLKDVFDSDILLHVILSGDTAILVDGCPQGIVVNTGDGRTGGAKQRLAWNYVVTEFRLEPWFLM